MKPSKDGISVVFTGVSEEIWVALRKKYPGAELVLAKKRVATLAQELGISSPQVIWDEVYRFESRGLLQDRRRTGRTVKWKFAEVAIGLLGGSNYDPEKPTLLIPEGDLRSEPIVLPSVGSRRRFRDEADEHLMSTYKKDVGKYPLLTKDEEYQIFCQYREKGDEAAREKMICHNLRLVISWAAKYLNRGLSMVDLVQYGNMGLMEAVERFDHTLGYRFSTYATHWIRQKIRRGLQEDANTIRISANAYEAFGKLSKAIQKLETEGISSPTTEQLARSVEMNILEVENLLELSRNSRVTELDALVFISGKSGNEEEGGSLATFIEDKNALSPETVTLAKKALVRFQAELDDILSKISRKANPRHRSVVVLSLGLDDSSYTERPYVDLTSLYSVSRQRIYQMLEKSCAVAEISLSDLRWLVERIRIASEVIGIQPKTYRYERRFERERPASDSQRSAKRPLTSSNLAPVVLSQGFLARLPSEWKDILDKAQGIGGNPFCHVIIKVYNLDAEASGPRTYNEVAKLFGVSKARIGEIIKKVCHTCSLTTDHLSWLAQQVGFDKPTEDASRPIVSDWGPIDWSKVPGLTEEQLGELRGLESALGSFPPAESRIFGLYYGLIPGTERKGASALAAELSMTEVEIQEIIGETLSRITKEKIVRNTHWLLAVLNRRS